MVAGATEVAAPLLALRDPAVSFGRGGDAPPAVAGVDLDVGAGEIVGGSVRLRGRELTTRSDRAADARRARRRRRDDPAGPDGLARSGAPHR
jgi:hypothetical protein